MTAALSCERCEKMRVLLEQARLFCRIQGRNDVAKLFFDLEEEWDKTTVKP